MYLYMFMLMMPKHVGVFFSDFWFVSYYIHFLMDILIFTILPVILCFAASA